MSPIWLTNLEAKRPPRVANILIDLAVDISSRAANLLIDLAVDISSCVANLVDRSDDQDSATCRLSSSWDVFVCFESKGLIWRLRPPHVVNLMPYLVADMSVCVTHLMVISSG